MNNQTHTSKQQRFTVSEAAARFDISEDYLRKVIWKNQITTCRTIRAGKSFVALSATAIRKWRERVGDRSRKNDGRTHLGKLVANS